MTNLRTFTAPSLHETGTPRIFPSGDVKEDVQESASDIRSSSSWNKFKLFSGALFAFASTVTSIQLPPTPYERKHDTSSSSVICFSTAPRGRRISIYEARRLALDAMEKAERRRADYAERQAKLLSIWEEGA